LKKASIKETKLNRGLKRKVQKIEMMERTEEILKTVKKAQNPQNARK
jgi:hypothetical protein